MLAAVLQVQQPVGQAVVGGRGRVSRQPTPERRDPEITQMRVSMRAQSTSNLRGGILVIVAYLNTVQLIEVQKLCAV